MFDFPVGLTIGCPVSGVCVNDAVLPKPVATCVVACAIIASISAFNAIIFERAASKVIFPA